MFIAEEIWSLFAAYTEKLSFKRFCTTFEAFLQYWFACFCQGYLLTSGNTYLATMYELSHNKVARHVPYTYKFLRYVNFKDVTNSAFHNFIFKHHQAFKNAWTLLAFLATMCCIHDMGTCYY